MGYNQTEAQNKCKQGQSVAAPYPLYTEMQLHTQRQNAAHCSTHYTLLALELQAQRGLGVALVRAPVYGFFPYPALFCCLCGLMGKRARPIRALPPGSRKMQQDKEVLLCAFCVVLQQWCSSLPFAFFWEGTAPPIPPFPLQNCRLPGWKSPLGKAAPTASGPWSGSPQMDPVSCCGSIPQPSRINRNLPSGNALFSGIFQFPRWRYSSPVHLYHFLQAHRSLAAPALFLRAPSGAAQRPFRRLVVCTSC